MTYAQELSLPLIETLAHEATIGASETASTNSMQPEEPPRRGTVLCSHMMTLLIPLLVLLQFAAAFAVDDETTAGLEWNVICVSTALFTLASYLFQKSLDDMNVTTAIAHLTPELVTLAVVALIFFRLISEAFILMLAGMLFMALTVVVSSVYLLMTEEDDKVDAPAKKQCNDVKMLVV